MTVETVWWFGAIIGAAFLWVYFNMHFLAGLIIGAFVGFIITSTMKMFGYRFGKSYSGSSNHNTRNDSCGCGDSWDD